MASKTIEARCTKVLGGTVLCQFGSATVWLTFIDGKVTGALVPPTLAVINEAIARDPKADHWTVRI